MTVATKAPGWQRKVEEQGSKVRDFFEAQLAAYRSAKERASLSVPVTEAWIRHLHVELLEAQDVSRVQVGDKWQLHTLANGECKRQPNHVVRVDGSIHAYAAPPETARLHLPTRFITVGTILRWLMRDFGVSPVATARRLGRADCSASGGASAAHACDHPPGRGA